MTDPQKFGFAVAGIVAFYLYVQLLCWAISLWSGWRELLPRFRAQEPFYGRIFKMQSARFRFGANYNNALNVGADNYGVYLSTVWIVPQHPPLRIPWDEIQFVKRSRLLWIDFTHFTLGREEKVPMAIRSQLSDDLYKEAGRKSP